MSRRKDKIIATMHRIFKAEGWVWFDSAGNYFTPDCEDIKKHIKNLQRDAKEFGSSACGRIRVDYDKELKTFSYYIEI